jgi:hypothetical protein
MRAEEVTAHERWLANLFAMRPGLTGLWRLRCRELPVEERVALDLYYIRNYTVSLDLQILLHTARGLLRRALRRPDGLARWEAERIRPVVDGAFQSGPSGAPVVPSGVPPVAVRAVEGG